ncbi:MAG: selenocysteine-specific translation elongation factor [Gemmatimonadota bacterium]|nr:MAG: selenocysteine-specific translation elongation factor [Gemmatimonadota bacterium]
MKSVILGTAGHVDHGKTVLVEALTGVNTDRWEEERQRGITIDLGFARFPTDSKELEISVVDVPGHEDFVKNMLAGATGIDMLLLVVAADEGPMPQTREHLWIARLLGVERGVAAVSKCDLVDVDWRVLAKESVRDEIAAVMGAVDWPVVAVSAVTGEGVDELNARIQEVARSVRARSDDDLFRLPVDRSFSVRGVGTVVTGTVWSGRIKAGAEIRILPADCEARVRGIQVHGADVQVARAGQRAALALAGVQRSQVRRGDWLTNDAVWRTTRYLNARLELLPDSPRPVKHWQRVRFHLGTAETMARVVLDERELLHPGDGAVVQLRLEEPVVARCGDRFVIRFYSPVTTIGGGVVIDPWASRHGRFREGEAAQHRALAALEGKERVHRVLTGLSDGASAAELAVLAGATPSELDRDLRSLATEGSIRELGERWYSEDGLRDARDSLLESLAREHARDVAAAGVSLESLRSAIGRSPGLVNAILADLQREGTIRIEGSVAALAGHVPRLLPEQERLAAAARDRIRAAGLTPLALKELAGVLGVPEHECLSVLKFLAGRGELVAVTPDLYFDSGAIRRMRARVGEMLAGGRVATPSQLREAFGVSRKYLIPLLEYLDASGFTRRVPAGRVLREV